MSSLKVKVFAASGVQMVNVVKSHLTIGSGVHCDIRPPGVEVASEHFRIWSDGNHLWGQDLGSGYATYLNGVVLRPLRPVLFRETDLFRIGDSGVSFSCQLGEEGVTREIEVPAKTAELESVPEADLRGIEQENDRLSREVTGLKQKLKRALAANPEEEEEISEVKRNAVHEINAMKDAEARRIEKWKREIVEEAETTLITIMKSRPHPKLTKEEVRRDVSVALRATILGEKIPSVVIPRQDSSWKVAAALVLAAALCTGYMFRSKLNGHKQDIVTYVPPGHRELSSVAPPSAAPRGKSKIAGNPRGAAKR